MKSYTRQVNRTRSRSRRRGVGLIELLIALAISATLLTATAIAIDASFKAYAVNQEQSDLTQRTRLAMYRMTSMIRQTKEHAPHNSGPAGQFSGGKVVDDTGIDMFDLSGKQICYRYDAANKQLLAVVSGTPHVLCEGVQAFNVRFEPMRSPTSIKTGGAWDLVKRATVQITVKTTDKTSTKGEGVGDQTMTLSASVMPRRNAW
jgi:prepilin-type N-terminal cleavage/methylation domain-containing protein